MTTGVLAVIGVCLAYLSGSIPWGVVLGKMLKGIDIRDYGSGNTGATNSFRILGWRIALAVALLDLLKGLLPVVIARLLNAPDLAVGAMAVAATCGHCWSPFMRFRGGKGMATGGGAAVGMVPVLVIILPVMILIVMITRYVSLASLTAVASGTVIAFILVATAGTPWPYAVAVLLISAIVAGKHHGNIGRLLSGTERRFGTSEAPSGSSG